MALYTGPRCGNLEKYFFLDAANRDEPVDSHIFVLAYSPSPLSGLSIGRWIPIRIVDDDSVGPCQVDAQTPDFGR